MAQHSSPPPANGHAPPAVPVIPFAAPDGLAAALALTFTAAEVPLDRVIENPRNHRRPDPEADARDDAELEDSIRRHGVLQPVIGWEEPGVGFHLTAGHRRCRCARRAGLATVPARLLARRPTDEEEQTLALLENIQRVSPSAIDLGLSCKDLMVRTGRSARELAQLLGKDPSSISRAVALVDKLPADLQELVGKELPPSVAGELTPLADPDAQRLIARRYYRDKELRTRAEVRSAVLAARRGNGGPARPAASGFAGEAGGVRFKVELPTGAGLTEAAAALRELVKELHPYRDRPPAAFQEYLDAKKAAAEAARKAAELQAAQDALAGHLNQPPERSISNG